MTDYLLIDSGDGQKLEQYGPYKLVRPCAQALWQPALPAQEWKKADATFSREENGGWVTHQSVPMQWQIEYQNLKFHIERTNFGHVGLFPEHGLLWGWLKEQIAKRENASILNLFGYTGAATLFAAKCGAQVCHLDASKKVVEKARENAQLNGMEDYPIRWIVDDVFKFLKREIKREKKYDGIILDPPSFGQGSKGEVFKFESDLFGLLELVKAVLSEEPLFVLLTCHTTGVTPIVLSNMLKQAFSNAQIETGELALKSKYHDLPKGLYAKCTFK